jgi:N-acetylglutamate synthase-like GNAT family acetyltransferase
VIRRFQSSDLDPVRDLFREYAQFVGDAICFSRFEKELAELPGRYAPPAGCLLLAEEDNLLIGCAALRPFDAATGEMKRLYVRPSGQGTGTGRALASRIIAEARQAGYQRLVLDTLPKMARAISMYRSLGFEEIPRYADNPPEALCFELRF